MCDHSHEYNEGDEQSKWLRKTPKTLKDRERQMMSLSDWSGTRRIEYLRGHLHVVGGASESLNDEDIVDGEIVEGDVIEGEVVVPDGVGGGLAMPGSEPIPEDGCEPGC